VVITPLSFGPLADIVGFHLARATVTAYAAFDAHIGTPFDLRKVEFSLLMLVLANQSLAPKRLARALAITAPNLTLLLDKLQARGIIQRERNPADGRSQHIVLSAAGQQLARATAAAAVAMEHELQTGRLSRAEHAILIELLDKLASHHPNAGQ
jgi:DNA-binding MarR family transcriptional regulator